MLMQYKIVFQPSGIRGEINENQTLLKAAQELGVELESPCGGEGKCGKCRLKILEGYFSKYGINSGPNSLSSLTEEEKEFLSSAEIGEGFRLACRTQARGDLLVFVPPEGKRGEQVILEKGIDRDFQLFPAVENVNTALSPPELGDKHGDTERLKATIQEKIGRSIGVDYRVLRDLPHILRDSDWKVSTTLWQGAEAIRVSGALNPSRYGMAIDIGTTTVAAYLCDLEEGLIKTSASIMNPQVAYGEDIISRISYCQRHAGGRDKLQQLIVESVNELVEKLSLQAQINPEDIVDAVVVCNTIMHHLFLGVDPRFLGGSPFVPGVKEPLDIKARDLGVKINEAAYVHVLPIIAGYVGADNAAFLIAEEPYHKNELGMYIDIGTNGEVDLGNKEGISCTSCATGPAMEGAQIAFGMRAAPGAIEKLVISPETLEPRFKVIGQEEWYPHLDQPEVRGLCGSGIIDAVAQLYLGGILDRNGRFVKGLDTPRLRTSGSGGAEYVLAWKEETGHGRDVVMSQMDIRAVQLAKAALYVGAETLLQKRGIEVPDQIVLAGAFGNFIDKESALAIGMFPPCSPEKIISVGNAAGDGACLALFDRSKRKEAWQVVQEVQFVETALEASFQERFLEALAFPEKE